MPIITDLIPVTSESETENTQLKKRKTIHPVSINIKNESKSFKFNLLKFIPKNNPLKPIDVNQIDYFLYTLTNYFNNIQDDQIKTLINQSVEEYSTYDNSQKEEKLITLLQTIIDKIEILNKNLKENSKSLNRKLEDVIFNNQNHLILSFIIAINTKFKIDYIDENEIQHKLKKSPFTYCDKYHPEITQFYDNFFTLQFYQNIYHHLDFFIIKVETGPFRDKLSSFLKKIEQSSEVINDSYAMTDSLVFDFLKSVQSIISLNQINSQKLPIELTPEILAYIGTETWKIFDSFPLKKSLANLITVHDLLTQLDSNLIKLDNEAKNYNETQLKDLNSKFYIIFEDLGFYYEDYFLPQVNTNSAINNSILVDHLKQLSKLNTEIKKLLETNVSYHLVYFFTQYTKLSAKMIIKFYENLQNTENMLKKKDAVFANKLFNNLLPTDNKDSSNEENASDEESSNNDSPGETNEEGVKYSKQEL